jgi:hypothetical protein
VINLRLHPRLASPCGLLSATVALTAAKLRFNKVAIFCSPRGMRTAILLDEGLVRHLDSVLGCFARTRIALRFIAVETTIAIFIAMKDDATVKNFDDLEIHRPELARLSAIAQRLAAQAHRAIRAAPCR